MKFKIYTILAVFTLLLTGCNKMDNSSGENNKITETLDPTRNQSTDMDNNAQLNHEIGFVRYTSEDLDVREDKNASVRIDRAKMADLITKLILQNDQFKEVATLVTDKYVLIAYDKSAEADAHIAADIAKKSSMSVMPSYYETYVSDNVTLMEDINSLQSSRTNMTSHKKSIDLIINEMKKSSQGLNNNM